MRRSVLLTILLAMTLFNGCQETKGNVFFIMFESTPNLFDSAVYAHGVSVGEIVEKATAGNGVTRLAIVMNSDQKDLMQDNTAFYVDAGRLTHATLTGYGNPVEPGASLMGFSSGMGMGWFKAKNLMT
ncbi:MAG: hypothetical protein GY697_12010, partial [Desulfobacterales bacterium]|nr:hypothetical protein [Desulfobacterales bacterium]